MKIPAWLPIFGDINFRDKNCPSESAEQITFFNIVRGMEQIGDIALHVRNEGRRSIHETFKQRAEGLTPGAPDIIIPGCPTFLCELKRKDRTICAWQKNQLNFLKSAQKQGAFVCLALGHEAAIEALHKWIAIRTTQNGLNNK